jgi:hypothetical protein
VSSIGNDGSCYLLIYTVSLDLELSSCVTIHNQCSNIKLVSPVYFCNGTVYIKLSSRQIDIGTTTKIRFENDAAQDEFEGALIYKLQGYVESDDQNNMDTLTTEVDENGEKCVQMLVAWKVKDAKPLLYVVLIEHAKEFIWDEDNLRKLYDKNLGLLKKCNNIIPDTWIIDDNMILKTSSEVKGLKGKFDLSISIFEEEDFYGTRPLYVDFER